MPLNKAKSLFYIFAVMLTTLTIGCAGQPQPTQASPESNAAAEAEVRGNAGNFYTSQCHQDDAGFGWLSSSIAFR